MKVNLTREAITAIEAALNRGRNVEIRRYKDGIVLAEISQKTVYRDRPIEGAKN